jgi:hypothetical protein
MQSNTGLECDSNKCWSETDSGLEKFNNTNLVQCCMPVFYNSLYA